MKKAIQGCLIIFAMLIFSSQAYAAEGFRLGTGIGIAVPDFHGDVIDNSGNFSGLALDVIDLGYGFTDAASLNFRLGVGTSAPMTIATLGFVGGWSFTEYALDFRWAFLTDDAFNPFLMAGVGFSQFTYDSGLLTDIFGVDLEVKTDYTVGFDVGGGCDFHLGSKKRWALGAMFYYHFVSYQNVDVDVDSSNSIWNINLDVAVPDEKIDGGIAMFLFTVSYTWRE